MNDWSERDYGLLFGALTGVHQDIQSTKEQLKKGDEEKNPLLGKNPSDQDLDKVGLATALLGTGAAATLPKEWRRPLMGAWAGLEHGLAYKNRNVKTKPDASFGESRLEGPLMMAALGGLLGHYLGDDKDDSTNVGFKFEKEAGKSGKDLVLYLTGEKKF